MTHTNPHNCHYKVCQNLFHQLLATIIFRIPYFKNKIRNTYWITLLFAYPVKTIYLNSAWLNQDEIKHWKLKLLNQHMTAIFAFIYICSSFQTKWELSTYALIKFENSIIGILSLLTLVANMKFAIYLWYMIKFGKKWKLVVHIKKKIVFHKNYNKFIISYKTSTWAYELTFLNFHKFYFPLTSILHLVCHPRWASATHIWPISVYNIL